MPVTDNSAWVDILEPLAPPPLLNTLQISVLLIAVVLLMGLIIYWWRKQPRQVARRHVLYLQRQLQTATLEPRDVVLQLRMTLCQCFRVNQLTQITVAAAQQPQWQHYCDQLTQFCYQTATPTREQLTPILQQACHWLRAATT